jgi:hypothetical protein
LSHPLIGIVSFVGAVYSLAHLGPHWSSSSLALALLLSHHSHIAATAIIIAANAQHAKPNLSMQQYGIFLLLHHFMLIHL